MHPQAKVNKRLFYGTLARDIPLTRIRSMEKPETTSFFERLHQALAEQAARDIDPWLTKLGSVRAK